MVLWMYGFMVSKIYQISMSCFQEDIDPISMIFKNVFNGSSGLFGARLFENYQNMDFRNLDIYKNNIL